MPNLVLISLLLFFYAIKEMDKKKEMLYYLSSLSCIFLAWYMWNGGGYAIATYIFCTVMLLLYIKFPFSIISNNFILSAGIIIVFVWLIVTNTNIINVLYPITKIHTVDVFPPLFFATAPFHIINAIAQFDPISYQENPLYSLFKNDASPLPYAAWVVSSFLFTTGLALFYLLKRKEDNSLLFKLLLLLLLFSIPFALEGWYELVYLPIIIFGASILSTIPKLKLRAFFLFFFLVVEYKSLFYFNSNHLYWHLWRSRHPNAFCTAMAF